MCLDQLVCRRRRRRHIRAAAETLSSGASKGCCCGKVVAAPHPARREETRVDETRRDASRRCVAPSGRLISSFTLRCARTAAQRCSQLSGWSVIACQLIMSKQLATAAAAASLLARNLINVLAQMLWQGAANPMTTCCGRKGPLICRIRLCARAPEQKGCTLVRGQLDQVACRVIGRVRV